MPRKLATKPINVLAEVEGADLGDRRRNERLEQIVASISAEPNRSLPNTFSESCELEAAYRFLRSEHVHFEDILEGHFAKTAERASASGGQVLALHDTTEMKFSGEYQREGLGWLRQGRQGFLAHCSMLVGVERKERHRVPLGILNIKAIFQSWDEETRAAEAPENERWLSGILAVEERLPKGLSVVHVADRESDSFHLLADLVAAGKRFVIRIQHDRRTTEGMLLEKIGDQSPIALTRKVRICARKPAELSAAESKTGQPALSRAHTGRPASNKKKHPAREERDAKLSFSVGSYDLIRPESDKRTPQERIAVNVVRVFETNAPEDCHPIEWMLFTSEPVSTLAQVAAVVDMYRARWLIEEFFKALKTGCSFEKLQLEKRNCFLNALAIYTPVAWAMLRLRSSAHDPNDEDVHTVLSKELVAILRVLRPKLPAKPTVRDALFAIAGLGGHIKQNGDPGWLTLGRGMNRLLETQATLRLFAGKEVINP